MARTRMVTVSTDVPGHAAGWATTGLAEPGPTAPPDRRAAGERVWLVSAAPVEIGRVIAARLGLTGAIGTVAEIRQGAYTGRLVGDLMHGPAKAEAIRQLADFEGLDLARCAAYSDSANDLPMLAAVGRAVAVNPDPALRHEARRQGWAVHDFRSGRRAARIAAPSTVAAGLLAGAVTTTLAARRRWKTP